jgi:hypothetical protein
VQEVRTLGIGRPSMHEDARPGAMAGLSSRGNASAPVLSSRPRRFSLDIDSSMRKVDASEARCSA